MLRSYEGFCCVSASHLRDSNGSHFFNRVTLKEGTPHHKYREIQKSRAFLHQKVGTNHIIETNEGQDATSPLQQRE